MSTNATPSEPALALQLARDEYNFYMRDHVLPLLGIAREDEDKLTDAEIALRIGDADIRCEFVRLAVAMLEANIHYYKNLAAPRQATGHDASTPVVTALLAAAAGYYLNGVVLAILFAAAGYWLGYRHATRVADERVRNADSHNAETAEWKQTIAGWELSLSELRAVEP